MKDDSPNLQDTPFDFEFQIVRCPTEWNQKFTRNNPLLAVRTLTLFSL